ncbi:MAG: glycerol kinase [Deltaproteobacteria bacterium RIFCSPHIGHO2_02_FULL_40_11]|nr:MAG: glycerol kinase [Deltaproteobacteria bacterium RIFCSPHIGHO2_02_FULL_40_11]
MQEFILAIDQGTTGTTALLINQKLEIAAKTNHEFRQIYPQAGWVEHDLNDIWQSTLLAISDVLKKAAISGNQIAAIGITNQRETTCLWEKKTGKPLANAIVWQCRRTASICETLKKQKKEDLFRNKTGLVLDPYFSGTKMKWLLDKDPHLYHRAQKNEVIFGTIDSFLVSKLTNNASFVTDASNASRTLLMNLKTLQWDEELLDILKIPREILPEIKSSSEIYGKTKGVEGLPDGIPISGIAGDQQAALFGQACFEPGHAKCTYGTGSFLLANIGSKIIHSKNNLITTVAWKLKDDVTYALEGSAFIAGAAVQWLRDGLGIIRDASEMEALATSVTDTQGVVFVPALTGLGAPYWKSHARGMISGLTRGTTKAHLARAALEGIAFENHDLAQAMQKDMKREISLLKVDGGASQNNFLMQFQSDLLKKVMIRPKTIETTAIGAACLAGLAIGFWKDLSDIQNAWQKDKAFTPKMSDQDRTKHLESWQHAIRQCLA